MIDIHIHILPNVDDGANSMDEAINMARLAFDSGVEAMVVTPHSNQIKGFINYNDNNLINLFDGFKNELIHLSQFQCYRLPTLILLIFVHP